MHQTIIKNYHLLLKQAQEDLAQTKKKINSIISLRIVVFFSTLFGCYYFINLPFISLLLGIAGALLFVYLVQVHAKLSVKKKYFENKIKLNQIEIDAQNGIFDQLETGEEFLNPNHAFSYDIDLFGKGTFFQFINRTSTDGGKKELADILQQNDIKDITIKQESIKELAPLVKWRQHFLATSSNITNTYPSSKVVDWITNYQTYLPTSFRLVLYLFPLLSIVFLFLLSVQVISTYFFVLWFSIGMFITGYFIKKTNLVYHQANQASETINDYAALLSIIEQNKFKASTNKQKQESIKSNNIPASQTLKQFGKTLQNLNSRNNLIVAIIGNALFLWELNAIFRLEKWIKQHKNTVPNWFDSIYYFDAQISCANFAYNNPTYSYPIISKDNTVIKTTQIGHPLINSSKRINNDVTIKQNNFIIITGANMAGKSTFLRTISLNLVLANAGMPVCAQQFEYTPIKLITSMRTSDSLQDDESYFFSELKRLKYIVDQIQKDTYFIILDEILKGTNSKDKEIGSKKFVKKLVESGSTGIIATHDLALCNLAQEFPQVINYYFDAEIINDELHFDYTMKNGICKNMNASFLLQKMNIV